MECTHTAVHTLLSFHNLLRHYVRSNTQKRVFIFNGTNILETRRNGTYNGRVFFDNGVNLHGVCGGEQLLSDSFLYISSRIDVLRKRLRTSLFYAT